MPTVHCISVAKSVLLHVKRREQEIYSTLTIFQIQHGYRFADMLLPNEMFQSNLKTFVFDVRHNNTWPKVTECTKYLKTIFMSLLATISSFIKESNIEVCN